MACEVFKIVNKLPPEYIQHMISIKTSTYNFTGTRNADIPRVKTTRYGLRSFRSEAPRIWNSLPNNLRVTEPVLKAAPELGWPLMWVPSVLCLPLFLLFAYALPPCALLCRFAFHVKTLSIIPSFCTLVP